MSRRLASLPSCRSAGPDAEWPYAGVVDASEPSGRDSSVREALLDAGAEEFWRSGLAGTRIQDILDRTTASRTSLYHHFAGKAEMADAIVAERPWQRLAAEHRALPARGLEAVENFLLAVAVHADDDVRARCLVRIAHELPDPNVDSGLDAWKAYLLGALAQAGADSVIPGAVATASVAAGLASLLRGVILEPTPREPLVDRVRELWQMMRPGLGDARVSHSVTI